MVTSPTTPGLSQADRALLATIINPETGAGSLSPADLAPFLARPEIQHALDSHVALTQLRLKLKLAAATERAIDNLDRLSAASPDPTESRRASTSLLTLAARLSLQPSTAKPPKHPRPELPLNPFLPQSRLAPTLPIPTLPIPAPLIPAPAAAAPPGHRAAAPSPASQLRGTTPAPLPGIHSVLPSPHLPLPNSAITALQATAGLPRSARRNSG